MTPIDFVVHEGDSDPNLEVYKVAGAMKKPIIIRGSYREYQVLSYYYDKHEDQMVLDIEPRGV